MTSFTRIVPEHVVWGVELCGQAGRQGKGLFDINVHVVERKKTK